MQKARKLPISVIMIVSNEAHNIYRSLGSIYGWVEEIVVVFNDCTDGTDRIARETFGARTYEHPWHGFRDQKRIAFDYAQQEWILGLDADEEVSIQLKGSIFNFFDSQACQQYQGAYFARKTWFLGRWITHGDWYPDHQIRLVQKAFSHYGGTLAHDKIMIQVK
jgi:glycosyltransferase involved in cell wall biosynthesis